MEILEHGKLSEKNLDEVVSRLAIDHANALVADEPNLTHWWSLLIDGKKWIYVGTLASFEKWRKERVN